MDGLPLWRGMPLMAGPGEKKARGGQSHTGDEAVTRCAANSNLLSTKRYETNRKDAAITLSYHVLLWLRFDATKSS